jgi:hypothetical protein
MVLPLAINHARVLLLLIFFKHRVSLWFSSSVGNDGPLKAQPPHTNDA